MASKKGTGRATGGAHRTVLDKGEHVYEALKKKMPVGQAAAIANAYANGTLRHHGGRKKG
jgi:hypothetical protein